jgi:hypothetical protein
VHPPSVQEMPLRSKSLKFLNSIRRSRVSEHFLSPCGGGSIEKSIDFERNLSTFSIDPPPHGLKKCSETLDLLMELRNLRLLDRSGIS